MLLRLQVRGQTGPAQAADEMFPSLLGGSWGHVGLFFCNFSHVFRIFGLSSLMLVFLLIFALFFMVGGGFWEDFGSVLGRFWMDFGKILFLSPASHLERHV